MKSILKWILWSVSIVFIVWSEYIPNPYHMRDMSLIAGALCILASLIHLLDIQKQKWIDVNKKLPKPPEYGGDRFVLAWWTYNDEFGHQMIAGWDFVPRQNGDRSGISHWKPLDEPEMKK
jgi:hypothetical protein